MIPAPYNKIVRDGLWDNNVAFVQILGLCPLLAVSSTAVNGLGLGLATMLVLMASNTTVSLIRYLVRSEIRIPVFVLVIASFVTAIELAMNAWFHELYLVLGIFIPLIVTNCSILGRAEAFASRNPVGPALMDGAMMGLGFTIPLVLLGAMREILGFGTLFSGADIMFGASMQWLTIQLFNLDQGMLLAILPPGAFIGLGLLIAVKNIIDNKLAQHKPEAIVFPSQPSQTAVDH